MCFVDEINGQCVQYVTGSDVQCPTCFRTLSIFLILKNTQVCRLYYLITHFLSPRKTCLSSLQNDSLNLSTFHFFSVVLSLTFCCCWLAVARAREFFLFSGVSRLVLRQTCDGNNLFVFFCFFVASHRVKETLRVSRADGNWHVVWNSYIFLFSVGLYTPSELVIDLTGKRLRCYPFKWNRTQKNKQHPHSIVERNLMNLLGVYSGHQ
jgi:hypothetical protein